MKYRFFLTIAGDGEFPLDTMIADGCLPFSNRDAEIALMAYVGDPTGITTIRTITLYKENYNKDKGFNLKLWEDLEDWSIIESEVYELKHNYSGYD